MLLSEDIVLRAMCAEDLPWLRRLYFTTRDVELAQLEWSQVEKDAFLTSQFELQHRYYQAHFPNAGFYVIQYRTQDIGRLYLDRNVQEFRLIDIALLPEWRGRGIGSNIVSSILAAADAERQPVSLHVEVSNPVLSLYHRLGFEILANNDVYLKLCRQPCSLAA